jgi:hypothetical protein
MESSQLGSLIRDSISQVVNSGFGVLDVCLLDFGHSVPAFLPLGSFVGDHGSKTN